MFWAIMCDRISQVSVAAGIENNLAGIDAGVFSSELLPSQSPYDDGEATSGTVSRQLSLIVLHLLISRALLSFFKPICFEKKDPALPKQQEY